MARRFTTLAALVGVSSALAVGGIGLTQASPDHGGKHHDQSKHDCHHEGSHHQDSHDEDSDD